jgi:maltoporin
MNMVFLYRLGNDGDNYFELLLGKKWDMGNGVKVGTYYMPTVYNRSTGTAQVYTDINGIADDPSVTLWVGQRDHRIQDVHILDNWLMQDGDNFGSGSHKARESAHRKLASQNPSFELRSCQKDRNLLSSRFSTPNKNGVAG